MENQPKEGKMPSISKLIRLGNWAKGLAQYEAANLAFGLALRQYFYFLEVGGDEVPWLSIESEDTIGINSLEVYYDLLTVETEKAGSLCIPVPLLHPFAAFCAAKTARLVSRGEHGGRKVREGASPEEIEELWEQLLNLFEDGVLEEVLWNLINLDEAD